MKKTIGTTLVVLASSGAFGAEKLREIRWTDIELPAGAELSAEGALQVRSTSSEGSTITLVEIDAPGVTGDRYVVEGRVRYEGVEGEGYLEMWSLFGAEGSFFTRTLGGSGLLQSLSGSSPWREFGLVFDASGASEPPEKLIVNVVFPGTGDVWLSSLTLSELDDGEWPGGGPGRGGEVGLWGGVAGTVLGLAGALFGWLGGRAKARRFVLTGLRTMIVAGGVALVLGVVALTRGAGAEVAYVLLLLGAVAVLAPLSALSTLKRRYEAVELRRMRALDA